MRSNHSKFRVWFGLVWFGFRGWFWWGSWGEVSGAVGLQPYVEEDQEEKGQDAPLQGKSRQTPQHGSLTIAA